jgi:hypothetical protein
VRWLVDRAPHIRVALAVAFLISVGLALWAFVLEPKSPTTQEHRLLIPDWRPEYCPGSIQGPARVTLLELHPN